MSEILEQYIDCHDDEILGLAWDKDSLHLKLQDYQNVHKTLVLNGLISLRLENLSMYNIVLENEMQSTNEASEDFWRFLLWDELNSNSFHERRKQLLEFTKNGGFAIYFASSIGLNLGAICRQFEWKIAPST